MKTADTIRVDQIADSVGKEIELNPQNKRIRAYHYKNEKQEIYYFVNEDEAVYSGEIRVPYLESCYAYDAWNGTKMAQEYRAEKEDATILSMKLRLGESRIVVVEQEKETVSQLEKSLFEMMYGVEKEKIPVKKNWEIGTCRSIAYPKFSNFQPITKFEDYGKKEKKFSGFIAYRNQMELSKDLNCSPSSRQLKKYKFFLPAEIYLLAVFMRLASKFRVFSLVLKFRDSFVSVYCYSNLYNLQSFLQVFLYR